MANTQDLNWGQCIMNTVVYLEEGNYLPSGRNIDVSLFGELTKSHVPSSRICFSLQDGSYYYWFVSLSKIFTVANVFRLQAMCLVFVVLQTYIIELPFAVSQMLLWPGVLHSVLVVLSI